MSKKENRIETLGEIYYLAMVARRDRLNNDEEKVLCTAMELIMEMSKELLAQDQASTGMLILASIGKDTESAVAEVSEIRKPF